MFQLRTIGVVTVGVTACAAIIVSVPLLWIFSHRAQEPFDTIPALVFLAGALAVCGLSLRAFFRARRESVGAPWIRLLALATPGFVVVGAALGIWFSVGLGSTLQQTRANDLVELCALPELWSLSAAACPERAAACREQGFAAPVKKGTPEVQALVTRLDTLRAKIDAEQWAEQKRGGFHDSNKVRPYESLVDDLNRTSDRADVARSTMVCLSMAAR